MYIRKSKTKRELKTILNFINHTYNKNLELQYRGRIRELNNLKPIINGDSDLRTAMKLIAASGKGPKVQIPSMGCNIKWFK